MSAQVYERGRALEAMLVRPTDRATVGLMGARKSPRRRKAGTEARPFGGPVYNPGSNPIQRPKQIETAVAIPREKNAGKVRGYRLDEQNASRAAATEEAKELVAAVADKLNIEDDKAKAALEFAVAIVKDDTVGVKERLAAARLTLDFTQPKPASKTELEIKKAEDFLDALAKDDTSTA